MRAMALWGALALLACGDDDGGDNPRMDASTLDGGLDAARDAAREASIDAAITKCGPFEACQDGMLTWLPSVCISSIDTTAKSALWKVCVVDPQGQASFIQIFSDQVVVSPGWTYSNYALVESTLTDTGENACIAARNKLILASEDNLPDGGSTLCYRPNNI